MRAFRTARSAVPASRCVRAPLVVCAVVTAFGGLAHAEEVTLDVERPVMYFGFNPDPTLLTLCGNGFLREAPSPNPLWTLDVYGLRSNLTTISGSDADTAQNGFVCVVVYKSRADAGSYTAVFRYQALPSDPPSQIVAQVAWYPGTEGEVVVTEQ